MCRICTDMNMMPVPIGKKAVVTYLFYTHAGSSAAPRIPGRSSHQSARLAGRSSCRRGGGGWGPRTGGRRPHTAGIAAAQPPHQPDPAPAQPCSSSHPQHNRGHRGDVGQAACGTCFSATFLVYFSVSSPGN